MEITPSQKIESKYYIPILGYVAIAGLVGYLGLEQLIRFLETFIFSYLLVAFVMLGTFTLFASAFLGAALKPKLSKVLIEDGTITFLGRTVLNPNYKIQGVIHLNTTKKIALVASRGRYRVPGQASRPAIYSLHVNRSSNEIDKFEVVGWDAQSIQPVFDKVKELKPGIQIDKRYVINNKLV